MSCANCSPTEYLAERVDAYKTATNLIKATGVEFDADDVLLVAWYLSGGEEQ